MKANKFFAVALAALALASCGEKNGADELTLDKSSVILAIDGEETITANVEATFAVDDATIVALTPANDGKSAKLKGLKEGNAVVTATSKSGLVKTCVVLVSKGGSTPGKAGELKGSKVWAFLLDETTAKANESKIAENFGADDVERFLYNWVIEKTTINTYTAGSASGLNFHGNSDGYLSWTVGTGGWAGGGFMVSGSYIAKAEELFKAIKDNPEKYYLHIAMKSTDTKGHCFYLFGMENTTKFSIGPVVYGAPKSVGDFKRDGSWGEIDVPMADYAAAFASGKLDTSKDVYIISFLSDGTAGTQFNVDALYFYYKD